MLELFRALSNALYLLWIHSLVDITHYIASVNMLMTHKYIFTPNLFGTQNLHWSAYLKDAGCWRVNSFVVVPRGICVFPRPWLGTRDCAGPFHCVCCKRQPSLFLTFHSPEQVTQLHLITVGQERAVPLMPGKTTPGTGFFIHVIFATKRIVLHFFFLLSLTNDFLNVSLTQ